MKTSAKDGWISIRANYDYYVYLDAMCDTPNPLGLRYEVK